MIKVTLEGNEIVMSQTTEVVGETVYRNCTIRVEHDGPIFRLKKGADLKLFDNEVTRTVPPTERSCLVESDGSESMHIRGRGNTWDGAPMPSIDLTVPALQ